jgi:hypothetical protein
MSYYVISGPLLNILGRTIAAGTPSPSADPNFPLAQLYDGVAAQPFRFGTSTSDASISFDLNLLTNPGFEIALSTTSTTGWLAVSGSSMTLSATYANNGTYSMKVVGMAYHDVQIRPNESHKFEWAAFDPSGSATVYIQIECMDVAQYLTSTGGWSTSPSAFVTETTAGGVWDVGSLTFVTPGTTTLLQDTATMRVMLIACGGPGYFDDILLYPALSWVSAHGHNWTTALTPKISGSSSASSSSYTLVDTLSLYRDVAYATFSTTYYRYWRFDLSGTPHAAPYCGELIFGQYEPLLENPRYGSSVDYKERQSRKESPAGTQYVYNFATRPQRSIKMAFDYSNSAQYYQSRRALMRASRGGDNLIALAAIEMDEEQVVYGRISEKASYTKTQGVFWSVGYDIQEDLLPVL